MLPFETEFGVRAARVDADNVVFGTVLLDLDYRGRVQDFADSHGLNERWIECHRLMRDGILWRRDGWPDEDQSKGFRGNYPSGDALFHYDPDNDVFVPQSPHADWVLNKSNWCWEPPEPRPQVPAFWNGSEWVEQPKPFAACTLQVIGTIPLWVPPYLPPDDDAVYEWGEAEGEWFEVLMPPDDGREYVWYNEELGFIPLDHPLMENAVFTPTENDLGDGSYA